MTKIPPHVHNMRVCTYIQQLNQTENILMRIIIIKQQCWIIYLVSFHEQLVALFVVLIVGYSLHQS